MEHDATRAAVDEHLAHIFDVNCGKCEGIVDVLDSFFVVVKDWRNARFRKTIDVWEFLNIQKQIEAQAAQGATSSGLNIPNTTSSTLEPVEAYDIGLMKSASLRVGNIYRVGGDPSAAPLSSPLFWNVIDKVYKVDASSKASISMISSAAGATLGTLLDVTPVTVFGYKLPNACSLRGHTVKPDQRFEICRRFRACALADLKSATKGQVHLMNWDDGDISPVPVKKVSGEGTSGWSVHVGDNGVRRKVVLDISAETMRSDLKWDKDAQTGIRILTQGSSLLTLAGSADRGRDTDV